MVPDRKTTTKAVNQPASRPHTASSSFFNRIGAAVEEPLLEVATGTLRFDLVDGDAVERWCVVVDHGSVTVTRRRSRADAIVRVDADLFDQIAEGSTNAMAAVLRGAMVVEGDLHLLMLVQRLFPSPPQRTTAAALSVPTSDGAHRHG